MFEHFGGAPFGWRTPVHLLGRQVGNRRLQHLLQLLEAGVHAGLLIFSMLRGRMLRSIESTQNIQDKDAMNTDSLVHTEPTVAETEKLGTAFSRIGSAKSMMRGIPGIGCAAAIVLLALLI